MTEAAGLSCWDPKHTHQGSPASPLPETPEVVEALSKTWLAGTELPGGAGGSGQQIPETQQEKVAVQLVTHRTCL